MTIRRLLSEDAEILQALRLRALKEAPASFASSYDEEAGLSLEEVAARLSPSPGRVVLGAFEEGRLVGMVGLGREQMLKLAHKGHMWGMYVAPAYRRRGLARNLVTAAIEAARDVPGLLQINISVYSGNEPARALYTSLGFVPFGYERRAVQVDGVHRDEEHLVLFLRKP